MGDTAIPPQLIDARDKIDEIDRELILLLAKRFALTQQVGHLKASSKLEALDARREEHKLATIRKLCQEQSLNPELVSGIFTQIMAEVVRNHRRLQDNSQSAGG